MMKPSVALFALILVTASFSNAFAQCRSSSSDVTTFWRYVDEGADPNDPRSYNSDVNHNLSGYGIIFEDANTEGCSAAAAVALYQKVSATLSNQGRWPVHDDQVDQDVSAYGGWLEGANVGLIYATGLELGQHGKLTVALDNLLMSINYPANIDAHCGFDADRWQLANSCMDDFSVAAHGWAWKSAYQHLTGRPAWLEVTYARQKITSALSPDTSVCVYPNTPSGTYMAPGGRGPCVNDTAPLSSGAWALGLHNGDAIPYGLGLMTSVSSAAAGMDVAGAPPTLTDPEKLVANALRTDGRVHTEFDSGTGKWVFKQDCFSFGNAANNTLVVHTDFGCKENGYAESGGYQPTMFPVYDFYNRYALPTDNASYDYSQWDGSVFCDTCSFFNPGRRAVYKTLAQDWTYPGGRAPLSGALNRVSLRTYYSYYLDAANGGGGAVDATPTTVGNAQQFGLIDLNGGTLNDLDVVQMQVFNGDWVVAEGGGGPGSVVNADRTVPDGWETFVIHKMNGGGQIVSGDPVSFSSLWYGYYVTAEGGGGADVTCNRTAAGPWETFTLTKY